MLTTKIYKNTTDQDMNVVGIGEIPAGEQVSLSSENLQPVMIANYPGLVDMTEMPTKDIEALDDAPLEAVAPVQNVETKTTEVGK